MTDPLTSYDFSICSDDLPPPFTAPWFTRSRWENVVDSATFDDDPDRLRGRGAPAVASAAVQAAEAVLTDPRPEVRAHARMVIEYFAEEHYLYESFDHFAGLRRRDGKGSLSFWARTAARDAVIIEMATASRWADLSPSKAAKEMKAEFARWEATTLPRLQAAARSAREVLEPSCWFWPIHQTGRGLPHRSDLKTMIEAARAELGDIRHPVG